MTKDLFLYAQKISDKSITYWQFLAKPEYPRNF